MQAMESQAETARRFRFHMIAAYGKTMAGDYYFDFAGLLRKQVVIARAQLSAVLVEIAAINEGHSTKRLFNYELLARLAKEEGQGLQQT